MDDGSTPTAGALRDPLRWKDSIALLRARWHARVAATHERNALQKLGVALARDHRGGAAERVGLRAPLADVAGHDARVEALEATLAASLQQDRADWAQVSSWLRPLVVFRGLATRCLIRDRVRRARTERRRAWHALGAAALDEGVTAPAGWAVAAAEARARSAEAAAAAETHATALRGAAVPTIAGHVVREAAALGKPLAHEVRGRLFPRVPALAGLAVGWWIAQTFTDSGFSAMLHGLGIGSGPRRVVSTEHLRAMEFWLPIAAAAICSYASGRIAALVRSRYAPADAQDVAAMAARTRPLG